VEQINEAVLLFIGNACNHCMRKTGLLQSSILQQKKDQKYLTGGVRRAQTGARDKARKNKHSLSDRNSEYIGHRTSTVGSAFLWRRWFLLTPKNKIHATEVV